MAIQKLAMKNVTVFDEITLEFSKGVNVLIGSNGVGKTHVMKLLYSACQAVREDVSFPHKVVRTFRPDKSELARLVRRDDTSEKQIASILIESETAKLGIKFASDTKKWDADDVDEEEWEEKHSDLKSVFIPAKEMLSHAYKLTEAVAIGNVEFDETYIDHIASAKIDISRFVPTASDELTQNLLLNEYVKSRARELLGEGALGLLDEGERELLGELNEKNEQDYQKHILQHLQKLKDEIDNNYSGTRKKSITDEREKFAEKLQMIIGGSVEVLDEHFYLDALHGKLEFNLLSEGLRKIALLWQLIQNGALEKGSILFWDEPEANLNPEHIPMIADLLLLLQREGVQVFVSTHDYFLAKYLDGRAKEEDEIAFFAFYREGGGVLCEKKDTFPELEHNPIMDTFMALYREELRRGME